MAHLFTAYRCNCCYHIFEAAPIYQCPNRHRYCFECYRRRYKGTVKGGGSCLICRFTGRFEKSDVNVGFLKEVKTNPEFGRLFQYDTGATVRFEDKHDDDDMYTTHLELESSQEDRYIPKSIWTMTSVSVSNVASCTSNTSLTCLHYNCNKTVAVSALYSHFRHAHRNVPHYETTTGRELRLLFDIFSVESHKTFCLALIMLYEGNQMDLGRSHSALNTSSMYLGRVPINNFWLMMSGPLVHTKANSYIVFWMYSNSEGHFLCTIELLSEKDKMCVSSLCSTVGLHESQAVEDVARNGNCLVVSRHHLIALLEEGEKINLMIKLH